MYAYNKPATGVKEQIELLRRKGLTISDEGYAERILNTIGYYRLKGFTLTFRDYTSPEKPFYPGTTIEQIGNLTDLDHLFRLAVFTGVQYLEPMIRTALTEELSTEYG